MNGAKIAIFKGGETLKGILIVLSDGTNSFQGNGMGLNYDKNTTLVTISYIPSGVTCSLYAV